MLKCTRSEMDITTVFGTVVGGSNPSGCTRESKMFYFREGSKDFSLFYRVK